MSDQSAEIARLRAAFEYLLPYTSHSIGCAIYQQSWALGEPKCTCRLDHARAALTPPLPLVGE